MKRENEPEKITGPEKLLTSDELAARWRVTAQNIRERRCDGTGPRFIRLGSTRVRYRLSDIEDWERTHSYANTTEAPKRGKP